MYEYAQVHNHFEIMSSGSGDIDEKKDKMKNFLDITYLHENGIWMRFCNPYRYHLPSIFDVKEAANEEIKDFFDCKKPLSLKKNFKNHFMQDERQFQSVYTRSTDCSIVYLRLASHIDNIHVECSLSNVGQRGITLGNLIECCAEAYRLIYESSLSVEFGFATARKMKDLAFSGKSEFKRFKTCAGENTFIGRCTFDLV